MHLLPHHSLQIKSLDRRENLIAEARYNIKVAVSPLLSDVELHQINLHVLRFLSKTLNCLIDFFISCVQHFFNLYINFPLHFKLAFFWLDVKSEFRLYYLLRITFILGRLELLRNIACCFNYFFCNNNSVSRLLLPCLLELTKARFSLKSWATQRLRQLMEHDRLAGNFWNRLFRL